MEPSLVDKVAMPRPTQMILAALAQLRTLRRDEEAFLSRGSFVLVFDYASAIFGLSNLRFFWSGLSIQHQDYQAQLHEGVNDCI